VSNIKSNGWKRKYLQRIFVLHQGEPGPRGIVGTAGADGPFGFTGQTVCALIINLVDLVYLKNSKSYW